jgi:hypothetical protein
MSAQMSLSMSGVSATIYLQIASAPLTTWPCVAEAMYPPGQINGWPAQKL